MNWGGAFDCIQAGNYEGLAALLIHECDPEHTLRVACREIVGRQSHNSIRPFTQDESLTKTDVLYDSVTARLGALEPAPGGKAVAL